MDQKMLAEPARCPSNHGHRGAVAIQHKKRFRDHTSEDGVSTLDVSTIFVVCLDCGKAEEAKL